MAPTARASPEPQKDRNVNQPAQLKTVLQKLEAMQKEFGGKKVSLANLIVFGGFPAIEKAAKDAGTDVKVPFTPGRMDASQEQTDALLCPARTGRRRLPHYFRGPSLGA